MKIALSIILATFFATGCTTQPQVEPIVKIVDKCSNKDISVTDIKGLKRPDGFMQAQITGENLTNGYFQVEYRIVWLDENDFTINSILSQWNSVPAYANEPFYINVTSPSAKAESFRVYIKKEGKIVCNHQSKSPLAR